MILTDPTTLPRRFLQEVETIAHQLNLRFEMRPDWGEFDCACVHRTGPTTASANVRWQPREDRAWRVRVDFGLRHEDIEHDLDRFFQRYPYHPPSPARFTYFWAAPPSGTHENPTTVFSPHEVDSLVVYCRHQYSMLRELTQTGQSLEGVLELAPAIGSDIEVIAVCLAMIGQMPDAISAIESTSAAAKSSRRKAQLAELKDWLLNDFPSGEVPEIDSAP